MARPKKRARKHLFTERRYFGSFWEKDAKCKTGEGSNSSTRCSDARREDIPGAEETEFRRPEGQAKTGRKHGEYRAILLRFIEKYS
jgi:hypothetical protein